jgi:hypothetical protein
MKSLLANTKFKLFAIVIAFIAVYGIIDVMPKHPSQSKRLISARAMVLK